MRFLAVLLLLLAFDNALAGSSEEGKRTAESFGSFLKNNMSSFSGALTGKTKLKTQSGEEFDATVESGSNQVDYIKLMVSNDELWVSIPGKVNTRVSGICENGYIVCEPGKWENCRYYLFKNGRVSVADSFQQLVSCFCVSGSACGFHWNESWLRWALNKFTNMLGYSNRNFVDVVSFPTATRDFQAVETTSVSESEMRDEDNLRLKLENNQMVKAYQSNPLNSENLQKECEISNYLNSPGQTINTKLVFLNGKELAGTACIGMEQENGSVYRCYLASNLSVSCGVGWSYYLCGKFGIKWSVADDVGESLRVGSKELVHINVHGDDTESQSGNLECDLQTGSCACRVSGTKAYGCSNFDIQQPGGCAQVSFSIWNNGGCNGPGKGSFWVYVKEIPDVSVGHSDSCKAIPKECKLKEEWVCFYPPVSNYSGVRKDYCVKTVSNYHVVTYYNKPVCYDFRSSNMGLKWRVCMNGEEITAVSPDGQVYKLGDYEFPRGWTYIKRVYTCPKKEGLNIDEAINRGTYIQEHSYLKENKVGFSGQVGCAEVNGKWVCYANNKVYSSMQECESECQMEASVTVPNAPYKVCSVNDSEGVYICKVAITGRQVRVLKGDVKMESHGDTYSYESGKESEPNEVDTSSEEKVTYEFRACEQRVNGDGSLSLVCPVSVGERVVKDCYCDTSDEAWKAASTIEMMDNMAHDIICSKE